MYQLSEEQKKQFAGVYLLDYMINTPHSFPLWLEGNNQDLEPILEWLLTREYVEILNDEKYIPSPAGRDVLKRFMARYSEYLTIFDIFSAVDLEAGEFAFASYFDFKDDASWKEHLNANKWDDLRVAVADYKEMNPVEIVFMNFINEKRFGRDDTGWQFDLLLGSVWDEILNICKSAIQWQDLGYEDDEGEVPAEDAIEDIIRQGIDIMLDLLDEEEQLFDQSHLSSYGNSEIDDEYFVDGVDIPTFSSKHYRKYRDPKYKSSSWNSLA